MLDAAMIEGAWKASPRATSEDGRDCHFRKAEWFEAPSAALARLVALDCTTTMTPAGLAFSPLRHLMRLLMAYQTLGCTISGITGQVVE